MFELIVLSKLIVLSLPTERRDIDNVMQHIKWKIYPIHVTQLFGWAILWTTTGHRGTHYGHMPSSCRFGNIE